MINLALLNPIIEGAQKIDDSIGACYYEDSNLLIIFSERASGPVILYKIDLNRAENLTLSPEEHIRNIKIAWATLNTMKSEEYQNLLGKTPLRIGKRIRHGRGRL